MVMSDIVMTSRRAGSRQAFESNRGSVPRLAVDALCFAATPTFAVMALLTAFGGGPSDMICAAMQHSSPLGGMVPMYLLMSAFHATPWLKLICGR
jgi:hypothetical protein